MPSEPVAPAIRASAASAGMSAAHVRPEEAEFFDLEREIPGFGGYSFDAQGNLVAYAKDLGPGARGAAMQRLGQVLNGRRGGLRGHHGTVLLKPGRFAFSELADWRDQLTDELLGKGLGVQSTDADEAQNRVVVEVRTPGGRAAVMRALAALHVPHDAVLVQDADSIAYEGSQPGGYLNGNLSSAPARGGLPVYWPHNGTYFLCTVGFYAMKGSVEVGVTNSHCSNDEYDGPGDNTAYFFSASGDANNFTLTNPLGHETDDRGFYDYCGKWYNPIRFCRRADANLFTVDATAPATAVGYIVRYTQVNPGSGSSGTYFVVNASNPSFKITARNHSRTGDAVNKVGATTAWTQGSVTATCKDIDMWSLTTIYAAVMKCQHEANYARDGGDSGAPVFALTAAGTADLRGVHWGRYVQGGWLKTVFSPLGGIEEDLGALSVLAPTEPAAPVYGVTLSGPTVVSRAGGYGTWTASAVNGIAPYTYTWWADGELVGQGASYTSYIPSGGLELDVEVTDASGEVAYASLYVEPMCEPSGDPSLDPCM